MKPGFVIMSISLLFITSCGGMASLSPTAPSTPFPPPHTAAASPVEPAPLPAPAPSFPTGQTVRGVVRPLGEDAPCWADRYPCETYTFTLPRPGAIDVTLSWEGQPRALMVQLYWAEEGLAHEDLAPPGGPSRISFRRPLMEATDYELRVVSLEPESRTPFLLTVSY